jgi:pimeloyl-ACP methyl ester carboxylesterase
MPAEEIIQIKNAHDEIMYGILHIPEQPNSVCINLLSPGLKNRVSPNRLYVRLARSLAEKGYHVLRMDPPGIGDSQGEIPEELVIDIWGDIQQGRFVQDAILMNDFLIKKTSARKLVMAGSCGGAISSLMSSEKDSRVKAAVLIDVPVTLASTKSVKEDYLSIIAADDSYRKHLTSYYIKSLFNPKKWLRVLTFKSDFSAIVQIIKLKIKGRPHPGKPVVESCDEENPVANINPHFKRAFSSLVSRKSPVLFLCAEKDTDTQLFYKGFRDIHLKDGNPFEGLYKIIEIEDANHIYTLRSSQDELIRAVTDWLEGDIKG